MTMGEIQTPRSIYLITLSRHLYLLHTHTHHNSKEEDYDRISMIFRYTFDTSRTKKKWGGRKRKRKEIITRRRQEAHFSRLWGNNFLTLMLPSCPPADHQAEARDHQEQAGGGEGSAAKVKAHLGSTRVRA